RSRSELLGAAAQGRQCRRRLVVRADDYRCVRGFGASASRRHRGDLLGSEHVSLLRSEPVEHSVSERFQARGSVPHPVGPAGGRELPKLCGGAAGGELGCPSERVSWWTANPVSNRQPRLTRNQVLDALESGRPEPATDLRRWKGAVRREPGCIQRAQFERGAKRKPEFRRTSWRI